MAPASPVSAAVALIQLQIMGRIGGLNEGTGPVSLLLHLVPSARAFGSAHASPPGSESEAVFVAPGSRPCGRSGRRLASRAPEPGAAAYPLPATSMRGVTRCMRISPKDFDSGTYWCWWWETSCHGATLLTTGRNCGNVDEVGDLDVATTSAQLTCSCNKIRCGHLRPGGTPGLPVLPLCR